LGSQCRFLSSERSSSHAKPAGQALPYKIGNVLNALVNRCRLIVREGHDTGKGYETSFRYEVFEKAFFAFVRELDPNDFSEAKSIDSEKLASLSSALTLVDEKIHIAQSKMKAANDGKTFSLHQDILIGLEEDKARVKVEYDTLRMRMASPMIEGVSDSQTLIDMIDASENPDALKLKIRVRLNQIVDHASVLTWDHAGNRHLICQVSFPAGSRRDFITGYSLTRKPYEWVHISIQRTERKSNMVTEQDFAKLAGLKNPGPVIALIIIKEVEKNQTSLTEAVRSGKVFEPYTVQD
jgi:hypothetical protein